MIDLEANKVIFIMKIITLNTEIFAEKIMVALIFEINDSSIYMAITFINQNTTVLFQIIILGSKI